MNLPKDILNIISKYCGIITSINLQSICKLFYQYRLYIGYLDKQQVCRLCKFDKYSIQLFKNKRVNTISINNILIGYIEHNILDNFIYFINNNNTKINSIVLKQSIIFGRCDFIKVLLSDKKLCFTNIEFNYILQLYKYDNELINSLLNHNNFKSNYKLVSSVLLSLLIKFKTNDFIQTIIITEFDPTLDNILLNTSLMLKQTKIVKFLMTYSNIKKKYENTHNLNGNYDLFGEMYHT